MFQSVDHEKFEIQVAQSKFNSFMKLTDISDEIIFVHPTLSLFFDKLTMIKFAHNEVLHFSSFKLEKTWDLFVNEVSASDFGAFKKNSLDFRVRCNINKLTFKCLRPEFGLIWMLKKVNSTSVLIALALLEFCDLNILQENKKMFSRPETFDFMLKLGNTPLHRFDKIWQIIEEMSFIEELHDFPLFLDRNIRIERKYDRIL